MPRTDYNAQMKERWLQEYENNDKVKKYIKKFFDRNAC